MGLGTVLVAVGGDDDEDRTGAVANTPVDIAGPAGATVALAHVFSESQYDRLVQRLDFDASATRPLAGHVP